MVTITAPATPTEVRGYRVTRPAGVTTVGIFTLAAGAIAALAAVPTIIAATGVMLTVGWIALAVGIVTIAAAVGLFRGNNAARILATIALAFNITNAIYTIVVATGLALTAGWIIAALAIVAVALLWTKAATAYFRA